MIIEGLFSAFSWLIRTILEGALTVIPPVPDWAVSGMGFVADLWALMQSFSHWVPVTFALAVVGGVLVVYLVGLGIGLARVVASYLTLGGGAT